MHPDCVVHAIVIRYFSIYSERIRIKYCSKSQPNIIAADSGNLHRELVQFQFDANFFISIIFDPTKIFWDISNLFVCTKVTYAKLS